MRRAGYVLKHYRSMHLHTANLYDNHKPFSSRVSQQHESSLTLQGVVRSGIILATHILILMGAGKSQSSLSLIISPSLFCLSKPCSSKIRVKTTSCEVCWILTKYKYMFLLLCSRPPIMVLHGLHFPFIYLSLVNYKIYEITWKIYVFLLFARSSNLVLYK